MFKPVHNGDRIRYSYARIKEVLPMPHLIDLQRKSYEWFIRKGLQDVFKDVSPIVDFPKSMELSFESFKIGEPNYDVETCKEKDVTYAAPLNVNVRLLTKDTGEIKESEVFMGDFPLMTDTGTFVINGAERVIVSQLVRSPGVYYDKTQDPMGKFLYGTTVIPNRGAWIEYETDLNDIIYARVDRTRKLPATALLRVMGLPTDEDIKRTFGEHPFLMETLKKDNTKNADEAVLEIYKKLRPGEPADLDTAQNLIRNIFSDNHRYDLASVGRYKINKKLGWRERLLGKELAEPIRFINEDGSEGETVLPAGTVIGEKEIEKLDESGIYAEEGYSTVWVVFQEKPERIIVTHGIPDDGRDGESGDKDKPSVRVITPADVIASFAYLLNVIDGMEGKDDIDHLGNRRVRCVGELLQNQFRIGMSRMERVIRERMSTQAATDGITPQGLINIRPVVAAVKEFFGSSQLSQFMDQNNPLAELTHKRRLSALGPGGLSRERAGYEVRDVHVSHYGRMCPIETPEGPNIGLIGSLAAFGVVNRYGFIETPYRRVDKETCKVTNDIVYMTADEEDKYIVAQANEPLNDDGSFVNPRVTCRYRNDVPVEPPNKVDYMDVSPKQVLSIAAALIPFLENDDANRALMGANMQRQAVPLLNPKAPVVGTGMEYKIAVDSGVCILAKHAGTVKYVSGDKIIITRDDGAGVDEYNVLKFKRSNQSTCVNQRPIVFKGDKVAEGQVLADGPATDHGELALGRNAIAAYMPWEGYNYEDAVLLSEDLVKDDVFTSIHIEEYNCDARDTKLGPEEITRDIPNVSEETLKDLDEDGIIRIGAEVRPGDILVGKVTPKGETELSAEERLIRAIFAEKAREVRDSSLRVPHGESGIIVSVQIFTRENGDELPPGVNKQVRVHIVQKRKISEGDKMAGRHGNKGVVSRIMPREDMPFLPNGEPVQIVLNPLGVPSRMNIGQILEAHLGWAAVGLGRRLEEVLKVEKETGDKSQKEALAKELTDRGYDVEKYGLPKTVEHAVPVAVPVFDSAREDDLEKTLQLGGVDASGKTILYDGRTGEPFDNPVTVGCIYYLKLHHLVADKIHARSTGPYSLVTQQPLGGKAQFGGQRFGEMEVWALEAYGAAYTLQEILTVKSDDVVGRVKAYEAIVKGENIPEPGVPESFKVLVKEMQSIGLDIQVLDEDDEEIDLDDEDEDIGMGDIARELDMDMASKNNGASANVGVDSPANPDDEELSQDEDQPEESDFDVIADIGNMNLDGSQGDDDGSDVE